MVFVGGSMRTLTLFLSVSLCASFSMRPSAAFGRKSMLHGKVEDFENQYATVAGKADSAFAKRFGNLAGKPVRTVSDAMETFTESLGEPINALYRNYVTDLVSVTHLGVVDARFKKDDIWCLGFVTTTDILLKNYPEKEFALRINDALAKSLLMDYSSIKSDAAKISSWAEGKTTADISEALRGEGSSPVSSIAKAAKEDEFWLYTKFFGIGLIKLMEITGTEATADAMEGWVKDDMGKASQKATSDLDQWNGLNAKLSMMETLMKEIEIREKKKMADRLEARAQAMTKKQERVDEFEAVDDEKKEGE